MSEIIDPIELLKDYIVQSEMESQNGIAVEK